MFKKTIDRCLRYAFLMIMTTIAITKPTLFDSIWVYCWGLGIYEIWTVMSLMIIPKLGKKYEQEN